MKILRISLCNLASLSGLHSVDFTRDPLRSAGLFAISGATGSGKSTLLDALCLALFDATPRLRPLGRMSELANGEKQNDPRTLLRRGTGEGFAEVAFIGVDQQPYTSRWFVRRSRNTADGSLQPTEMTLFQGHIPVGSNGTVDTGGKKTLVLSAIESKIGLTFEQFTRAVLLAQNDFATFLESDDRQRAEILQALTGTERFESISMSIHARCTAELRTLDSLKAQLSGAAPLSPEDRAAAEDHHRSVLIQQTELTRKRDALQSQTDWFNKFRLLNEEKSKAEDLLQVAISQQAAAESRRIELQITELLMREARPLRQAERLACNEADDAEKALIESDLRRKQIADDLTLAAEQNQQARLAHESLTLEHRSLMPEFQAARELDSQLKHLTQCCKSAEVELETETTQHKEAAERLAQKVKERVELTQTQVTLQKDRQELQAYVPLAAESAKWMDRLENTILAQQQLVKTEDAATEATRKQIELQQYVTQHQDSLKPLQDAFETAVSVLLAAREQESNHSFEQLAQERDRHETSQRVLLSLFQQLKQFDELKQRVSESTAKLQELEDAQTLDQTAIQRLQNQEIPAAELEVSTARTQLDLMLAAIHDHAKRLRTTLQDGKECPVCGSTSHPYSQHTPPEDATAVKEAKKHVAGLEKKRDGLGLQFTRLQASVEARTLQVASLREEIASVQQQIPEVNHSTFDDPEAAAIFALDAESRRSAAETRLLKLNTELRAIDARHRKAMEASQLARHAQIEKDKAEAARKEATDQLQLLLQKTELATAAMANANHAHQKAIEARASEMAKLDDIWTHLPASKECFEQDPKSFLQTFRKSLAKCSSIERDLRDVGSRLDQTEASIKPLQEAVEAATKRLDTASLKSQNAVKSRNEVLQSRIRLFDGRPLETVELEWTTRLDLTAKSYAEATRISNELEKSLAAIESERTARSSRVASARAKQEAALHSRVAWMNAYYVHHNAELTLERLDEILLREFTWIQTEREDLKKLDDAVISASGEARVRVELLESHQKSRTGELLEAEVIAGLESISQDLAHVKARLEETQAVLNIDDDRRRTNERLISEISTQDAKADPWRRLNDLLGSADGAKFRMIAQRKTLDALLSHANYQLSLLAPRYSLERIPESLNLLIVDRDMGDERRSVYSLSGGESFLVSLALALALASLTSNRLRIESLFIDEGFGSLDPDTLNTAMSALMQLESQGRKVGVISHVTEMTDGIPVQIQILKGKRGASRIHIPGAEPESGESVTPIIDSRATANASRVPASAQSRSMEEVASMIIAILERERNAGRSKVSSKVLRDEIQCDTALLKRAQLHLGELVVVDGRSLRLRK